MNKERNMTLGLDLGIASIGWCLYEDDQDNNPYRISISVPSFMIKQKIKTEKHKTSQEEKREECVAKEEERLLDSKI